MYITPILNKLLNRSYCEFRGKPFDGGTIMHKKEHEGYLGKTHWEKLNVKQICVSCWDEELGDFHDKYIKSMLKKNRMRCYSKSYIEDNKIEMKDRKFYETEYITEKGLSEEQIKMKAFIDGYDFIYDLKFDKKTNPKAINEEDVFI